MTNGSASSLASAKAATGIAGLDDVLGGGLARARLHLIEGAPGTGKTTIALQFLMEGARLGERCLYVALSESETELRDGAASHGWSLSDNIAIYELTPPESLLDADQQQSLLYSSDLELGETTKRIFEVFERVNPSRVVLDSLSEIRLLAQSSLRYRRQILALKHYFSRHAASVVLLDDLTSEVNDQAIHSIAHGVIRLDQLTLTYGAERRQLRVMKFRGQPFRGGLHDFTIKTGGVQVFPRLVASEQRRTFARDQLGSGIRELDALLGGGLERGSSSLLIGPAGGGKSLMTLQFIVAATGRGEKAALFVFDEELGLLIDRAKPLGIDLQRLRDEGKLHVEQVDAAEQSPGEFAHKVRAMVEQQDIRTVVIDSLNGYHAAMPQEQHLLLHMHELLQYLNRQGATTFLTVAQHGLVESGRAPIDVSYLADTVLLIRYFELLGHIRRAISVVKKRAGAHETTIRELVLSSRGIQIGPVLENLRGVLQGMPTLAGGPDTSP
ncbi:MAG TPA: ATPase domain-containing protein [Vineibacter sp.]|nr:ATPase domain-containing protein [Vineibacter sp.]